MGDALHCLIPKSSVCILAISSLIEATIEEETMSYCYFWIFGYYEKLISSPRHLSMPAPLNMGLMWWVKNHNLRGGQEIFQFLIFYSIKDFYLKQIQWPQLTGQGKTGLSTLCAVILSCLFSEEVLYNLYTHGEMEDMRKESLIASLAIQNLLLMPVLRKKRKS